MWSWQVKITIIEGEEKSEEKLRMGKLKKKNNKAFWKNRSSIKWNVCSVPVIAKC